MECDELLLIADLADLLADLGRDGGAIGPSIYDTAQVLRAAPSRDRLGALTWLTEQQREDGGWGDPVAPHARDVPTLAAVLALVACGRRRGDRCAVQRGIRFLRRQITLWATELPDDIPVAAELVLPRLLDDARAADLGLEPDAYAALQALGARRRRLLSRVTPEPASPLAHSWETWGTTPVAALLDDAGSVGHSPTATAAWMAALGDAPEHDDLRDRARAYLDGAARATGVGVPGVVAGVWPFPRNEQIVSLYTVLLAGLLDHPALRDVVGAQLQQLARARRPEGYGISDLFRCDGDLTAMAVAVLTASGQPCDAGVLRRYLVDGMCLTYPQELQRSRSATAHAAHALALVGADAAPVLDALLERRDTDGRFTHEKWHASVWYLTSHAMHACVAAGRPDAAAESLDALLTYQRSDGGWGCPATNAEETAYGALGLLALHDAGWLPEQGQAALHRAARWLRANYRPLGEEQAARWIGKELYRPRRIARVEEVAATLACVRKGFGL